MFELLPLALLLTLQTVSAMPLSDSDQTTFTSTAQTYSTSTEFIDATTDSPNSDDETILKDLDVSITKIANVYMQALFSGTHTSEMEKELSELEMRLFDLLDSLYKKDRLAEYMKYEAEVTHQLIVYNLLKKLFGYAKDEN